MVGGDDSVCWLQMNTSADILAMTGVYMAALMAGVEEKYSLYFIGRDGSASTSALLRYCSSDGNSLTGREISSTHFFLT